MAFAYSTVLLAQQGLDGNIGQSVPAGIVVVIRCATVYWGGGTFPAYPSVHLIAGAGESVWYWEPTADQNAGRTFNQAQSALWQGRVVVNPGDLYAITVANGPCDVHVSGYHLTAG